MLGRNERVYINKGEHVGKYGKILIAGKRVSFVKIDQNFGGGSYYILTSILEKE